MKTLFRSFRAQSRATHLVILAASVAVAIVCLRASLSPTRHGFQGLGETATLPELATAESSRLFGAASPVDSHSPLTSASALGPDSSGDLPESDAGVQDQGAIDELVQNLGAGRHQVQMSESRQLSRQASSSTGYEASVSPLPARRVSEGGGVRPANNHSNSAAVRSTGSGGASGGGIGPQAFGAQSATTPVASRQSAATDGSGEGLDVGNPAANVDAAAMALNGLGNGTRMDSASQLDMTGGASPDATSLASPNLRLPNALEVASPAVVADSSDTLLLLGAGLTGLMVFRRRLVFWV